MEKLPQNNPLWTEEQLRTALKISHVVLDMDGTIYLGERLFDCTLEFLSTLKELGIGYSFMTNNPTRTVGEYVTKLRRLGIEVGEGKIYTSTLATIDLLRAEHPQWQRLFVLGATATQQELSERGGYEIVGCEPTDEPDAVVVSFDTSLCYERLCRAAWWVSQGKPYIITNPDRFCPTDQPTVLVDCGSIAAAINTATLRQPDIVVGKPNPEMLRALSRRTGIAVEHMAMVGDRLATDVQTAHNAGAIGVLVLSGENSAEDAAEATPKPHLVLKDVGELGKLLLAAHKSE